MWVTGAPAITPDVGPPAQAGARKQVTAGISAMNFNLPVIRPGGPQTWTRLKRFGTNRKGNPT